VVDGDDSSLCGLVGAEALVPLGGLSWTDVPLGQRCPPCQLLAPGDDGLGPP
jgi:hypothetical protein